MKKTMPIIIAALVVIALIAGSIILLKKDKTPADLKLQTPEAMQNMLDSIYESSKIELPSLETTTLDITDELQLTTYTGLKSNENVSDVVISTPFINAQAYSVAVVKVKDKSKIEQMKKEMLDNIDMRRWICVTAEKLYITNYENVIFLIMTDEATAKPIYDEFKAYVDNKIGRELEKTAESEL